MFECRFFSGEINNSYEAPLCSFCKAVLPEADPFWAYKSDDPHVVLTYTRNTATKYSEKLLILFRNEMSDKIGMALLLG